jgi:hypothetical protein
MIPSGPGLWYKKLRAKGFFKYVGKNILLILLVYAFIIFLVFMIGKYLVDFNGFFNTFIERLSDHFVILLFFASESFMGMIPVDLFVIWAQKFEHPMPYLALLGILSVSRITLVLSVNGEEPLSLLQPFFHSHLSHW